MRWSALLLLSLGAGLAQLALCGWGVGGVRVELLFLLAYHAGLNCRQEQALAGAWWCGLARDLLLGQSLGASALAYMLAGAGLLALRERTDRRHVALRLGFVFAATLGICLVRTALESRGLGAALQPAVWRGAGIAAALTALCCLPAGLALALPVWRPWRSEGGTGLMQAR